MWNRTQLQPTHFCGYTNPPVERDRSVRVTMVTAMALGAVDCSGSQACFMICMG